MPECVKVMVRVRPMNSKEKDKNCKSCVDIEDSTHQITLNKPNEAEAQKIFSFDNVFAPDCLQEKIYEESAFSLVESVVEGYNGTIFAYGQTGCGKTFTMMGVPDQEKLKGVIPRTFSHIIKIIDSSKDKNFLVRCSYIEIYNEEIRDLLSDNVKAKLDLKESTDKGVFIKDLNMIIVKSVGEMEKFMNIGNNSRTTGETMMNKDSSRSHSIFSIYVEASQKDEKGNERFVAGKLNLVDLAGSERQSKTGATGDRLKEANKINLSLSALGNVISALVDGKSSHVPYRDSKLTRLLQDSLGGNTKTVMIAAVSPADYNFDETLGTLRYASRAKNIQNKPKVNEDPKDALLKEYAEEIKRLKMLLETGGKIEGNISLQNGGAAKIENTEKVPKLERKSTKEFNQLQDELKKRNEDLNAEKQQREKLQNLIQDLEKNRVVGGKGDQSSIQDYNEIKLKIKEHHANEEKLLKEKKKAEDEMLVVEKKYQNLQEEVEELRKINKKLKKNYKNAINDLQDIEKEHEVNREDLLDSIREQERDLKLFYGMLKIMIKPEEINKVKAASVWDDNLNDYRIPPFTFQEAKVKFPKLAANQGKVLDMIENEKNGRELVFNSANNSNEQTIQKKKFKEKEIERNTFSLEPIEKLERRKSKIFATDVGPYLQQQSANEKDNFHMKKENSSIPKLAKLPSKKLDRKNSMEKLTQKYNMYQPQAKDTMTSNLNKILNDPNYNDLKFQSNNSNIMKNNPKKNLNGFQLDPLVHRNNGDSVNSFDLSESHNSLKGSPEINHKKQSKNLKGKLEPLPKIRPIEEEI